MHCNVLVVGSGIAGCMSALAAADNGAKVVLASLGPLFSGSSFYGGTWGLGLIAPQSDEDAEDLIDTITQVGCNAVRPNVVRAFVEGIRPAIARLEGYGVHLRRPAQAEQREYVACFDHTHRDWHGIERDSFIQAINQRIAERDISVLTRHELLEIHQNEGRVCGATLFDHEANSYSYIGCEALVLACGGASTLFARHLSPVDCLATAQALAIDCGAQLENYEFLQFMPGMVWPKQHIVFNEKAFRFCAVEGVESVELLDERSTYGPFTCRLESSQVDMAIRRAGADGLPVALQADEALPEFVQTYYDWLRDSFGLSADQPVRIAHYAHASNGGILIDENAQTSVPGLFAAGEATGGMHGADRLGGLSSANCLVFGLKAGEAASLWAQQELSQPLPLPASWQSTASPLQNQAEDDLRRIMELACSIQRTEAGLNDGLRSLQDWEKRLLESAKPCPDSRQCAATRRTVLRLRSAQAFAQAALDRTESLGSHCRV